MVDKVSHAMCVPTDFPNLCPRGPAGGVRAPYPSGAEQRSGADGPQRQLFSMRGSVPGGRRSPRALGAMAWNDPPAENLVPRERTS